jgi:invasion protein IalB
MTSITSLGASLVGFSVLTFFFTPLVLAQDQGQSQTKTPGVQQPAPPAIGQPAQPQAKPNWSVTCNNSDKGLDCQTFQSLFVQQTGQRLLTVAVRIPPDTKKPVLLVQLPLGIYLPAGATLQVGKDPAKGVPLQTCDQSGCIAEYPITDAEIAAMVKGADLTVSMKNMQNESVPFTMPVLGFAAVYAKIK